MRKTVSRGLAVALGFLPAACGGDEAGSGGNTGGSDAAVGGQGGSSGGGATSGAGGRSPDAAPWDGTPTPAPEGSPWPTLAEWHLFGDGAAQEERAEGLEPFDVISVLFADDAGKNRFLWIPPGETIIYSDEGRWEFPVGTIIIKTFFFPVDARNPSLGRRVIETRLLVHQTDRWVGHVYLWNEAQTEAVLDRTGETVEVTWTDADGAVREQIYEVPDTNQCQQCHGQGVDMRPLGPRTRQLDRDNDYGSGPENQLEHFASLGWFDRDLPSARIKLADPLGDAPLIDRVRAYFDANCGHCHGEGGQAHSTNLHLSFEATDPETGNPSNWGICKFPTSAGHASGGLKYDVVPGDPELSIIVHRMEATDDTVQMPPLLTQLADPVGVALVREWILAMPPRSCGDDGATDAGPTDAGAPDAEADASASDASPEAGTTLDATAPDAGDGG